MFFLLKLGTPQRLPKRLRFVVDVSGSMYRFNSLDGRLGRVMEAACLVMEAFHQYDNKIKVFSRSAINKIKLPSLHAILSCEKVALSNYSSSYFFHCTVFVQFPKQRTLWFLKHRLTESGSKFVFSVNASLCF